MELKSIQIKNFKGFKEKSFVFSKRFALIIGDNGTGKTSVLEALSVGLGGYLTGLDGVKARNILLDEVRRETIILGDASKNINEQFPVEITCSAKIDEDMIEWRRTLNGKSGKTTHKYAKQVANYASNLQKTIRQGNNNVILPVIAYMSAARTWSQKKAKWEDPFQGENISRFTGYVDCLDAESNIKLFVRWLQKMQLILIQKNRPIGELNAVTEALRVFLQRLLDTTEDILIYYDFRKDEVMVDIGNDSLPLNMMSAGYQSVIGMVTDLAYRMALLNPQLRDKAVIETPGVVLIDEIDLHIHPKWQWRIVNALKNTFPKIQFIATTHSPIIIASCEENELIYLYEKDGEIKNIQAKNPYGWLIEDVLTDIMGADKRSPETEKLIKRVEELYLKKVRKSISSDELHQMKQISNDLLELLPEGDPAVTLAKLDAIEYKLFGSDQDA